MINTICICGAGTMGAGIAQVCAQHGLYTVLYDLDDAMLEKARSSIKKNLHLLEEKGKISGEVKNEVLASIKYVKDNNDCLADVILEAIVEKADAKIGLFNRLAEVNHSEVIFASNTSSLSISSIQEKVKHPERVVGMHFFNPAPLMNLVEVIKGASTSDQVTESIYSLCKRLGKTPVICNDSPGFVVNRVARHYYLEAMRLVEKGIATIEEVDKIMEGTGFKMGPFKLMDLIGLDVNLSVSRGLFESFDHAARFEPSSLQIEKVKNNELGKKTGKGFYNYT